MNQLEKFLYYSAPHMWLQVADELKNTIDDIKKLITPIEAD